MTTPASNPPPVTGSPSEIAAHLGALAAAGATHLQLVLDPISVDSLQAIGAVLAELDG